MEVSYSILLNILIRFYSIGIINKFLSHRRFHSLAKLTYGAYLWHALVIFVNYLGRDKPVHYTTANIVCILIDKIFKNKFYFYLDIRLDYSYNDFLCFIILLFSAY
jgi:hypothetical protein